MRKQFDGIIYACTKDAKIESIYSPQFGQVAVESDTKPIDNRIRASEGKSCKFTPYCKVQTSFNFLGAYCPIFET